MANTSSALKEIRKNARRRKRNRLIRSTARTHVKHAQRAIDGGDAANAEETVRQAVRALDKAAEKGIIHKNNAARRKSRLIKRMRATIKPA